MTIYFDLIKRLYSEQEFDLLLQGLLKTDDDIDISPGSGFHYRQRKPRKNKHENQKG